MNAFKETRTPPSSAKRIIALVANISLIVAYIWGFEFFILSAWDIDSRLKLLIAISGTWVVLRTTPATFVAISLCVLGATTPQFRISESVIPSILYAMLWIGYVSALVLFHAIRRSWVRMLLSVFHPMPSANHTAANKLRTAIYAAYHTMAKLILIVIASVFMVRNQPLAMFDRSWSLWAQTNKQVLWPNEMLVICLIGIVVILVEWRWRDLSQKQATMYLRSFLLHTEYSDLRRILKSRRNRKRTLPRAQKAKGKSTT